MPTYRKRLIRGISLATISVATGLLALQLIQRGILLEPPQGMERDAAWKLLCFRSGACLFGGIVAVFVGGWFMVKAGPDLKDVIWPEEAEDGQ